MKNTETQHEIRIESLDWLRGFMAMSILLYHLSYWIFGPMDSSSILGRLGVYGVSIFFILSGLSLAHVYHNYFFSIKNIFIFFVRRIFRIWPLLWIACFLVILPEMLNGSFDSYLFLVLNLTTIFGFVYPNAYLVTGAWSIGNEMVYYSLTPFLFYFFNLNRLSGNCILFFSSIVALYFSCYILIPSVSLGEQWSNYVNPLNNLVFYTSGVWIYYNVSVTGHSKIVNYLFLALSIMLLFFYPINGDLINIVTGKNRVVMVISSVLLVISFYRLKIGLPKIFNSLFGKLGQWSYGIYLLHPLIYDYIEWIFKYFRIEEPLILGTLVLIFTLFISFILFKFVEVKFVTISKKLTRF